MNTRKRGTKSKGQGHNSIHTHHERQIQHAWELMRIKQKKREERNMAEWDKGTYKLLGMIAVTMTSLYAVGAVLRWLSGV